MFYVPPKAWGNVIQLDPRAHICSRNSLSWHHPRVRCFFFMVVFLPSQRKFRGCFMMHTAINETLTRLLAYIRMIQGIDLLWKHWFVIHPRIRGKGGSQGKMCSLIWYFWSPTQKKNALTGHLLILTVPFFLEGGNVDPTKSHFVALQFAIINFCVLPQRVPAGSEGIRTLCAGLHGWSH